jgi:hypothetical protein
MSAGFKSTLGIHKPKEATPVFDPEGHYAELHGVGPTRLLQGCHIFTKMGVYIESVPKEQGLPPLTAEQEQARRVQMQKNKKFFGTAKAKPANAAIPQKVIEAQRENAQALMAEHQAA